MANDDWDSVSTDAPPNDATDPWDAVSTPQPQRPKVRQSVKLSISRRFVLLGLAGLVIAALASGITWFAIYHVSGIHTANSPATATAQTTATVQAVAAAGRLQQIFNRAISGTPAIADPLSSENGDFGILNTTWGGACAFTGGAYHLSLAYPVYWIWCVSKIAGNLNNFALQVQVNITKGDDGGVVFGYAASGFYRTYIRSNGAYALLEYIQSSKQTETLRYSSSPAIKTGFNQTNLVTVVVISGSFYLFVNSQFVTSDTLNDYNQGAIGLAAESLTQPTDIAFSNMKVWTF